MKYVESVDILWGHNLVGVARKWSGLLVDDGVADVQPQRYSYTSHRTNVDDQRKSNGFTKFIVVCVASRGIPVDNFCCIMVQNESLKWSFFLAILSLSLAYFTRTCSPWWCCILLGTGIAWLIYAYYRSLTVIPVCRIFVIS